MSPQLPLVVSLCPAYRFFDPPVNCDRVSLTKVVDFKSLIFNSLLITANSDITINHMLINLKVKH